MPTKIDGIDEFDTIGGSDICAQTISMQTSIQGVQTITSQVDTVIGSIGEFSMIITPKFTGSRFLIEALWQGEVAIGWNVVFNVRRDGARINVNSNNHWEGLSSLGSSYAYQNDASTIDSININTLDTIGSSVGVPITFDIVAVSNVARTMWTNRCFAGVSNTSWETGVSFMRVTEYKL